MNLTGERVKVWMILPDGREVDLSADVKSMSLSQSYDPIEVTELGHVTPRYIPAQQWTELDMTLIVTDEVLMSVPSGSSSALRPPPIGFSDQFCTYCWSDWGPDARGNCGACGAPRKAARAYG